MSSIYDKALAELGGVFARIDDRAVDTALAMIAAAKRIVVFGGGRERLQIMGDHQRVEVDGVIEVRHHRNPPFKADDPAATLADGQDTLTWKPNLTAAANEDFKGYNALFGAFFDALNGKPTDLPTIDDGVHAMRVLEAMIAGMKAPGVAQRFAPG